MTARADVVVIGAGPYGLSVVAHLQDAGIEPRVFGRPMVFWKEHMPRNMILRSRIEASNIHAPGRDLSVEAFQKTLKRQLPDPLPVEDFIAYGEWFQKRVVPQVDGRQVRSVSQNGSRFAVTLEDGERLDAGHVVLALGIGPFLTRPDEFAGVPRELAPHSSDVSDSAVFRGKRVAVIGKGQSALEGAALLRENGADVTIVTRGDGIRYRPFPWRKHLFRQLTSGPLLPLSHRVFPPTDLGDIKTCRMMADPEKFRRQSPEVQEKLINDCRKPVGAYWLEPRLSGLPIKTRTTIAGVDVVGGQVKLKLSDGSADVFDRVLLATGYTIDISKYAVLDDALRKNINTSGDGYPILSTGLETSVPGLFMAGVVGERTLGPTLRFVTGTSNASPRLAAAVKKGLRAKGFSPWP